MPSCPMANIVTTGNRYRHLPSGLHRAVSTVAPAVIYRDGYRMGGAFTAGKQCSRSYVLGYCYSAQLSVAVTSPVISGTKSSQLPFSTMVLSDGHTVTWDLYRHLPSGLPSCVTLLPCRSLTVIVTVWVVPSPLAKRCLKLRSGLSLLLRSLSVAVTSPVISVPKFAAAGQYDGPVRVAIP